MRRDSEAACYAGHYHDEHDSKLMREMRKLAPEDFKCLTGANNIIGRENSAIPKRFVS
jgi:hypothetical protein